MGAPLSRELLAGLSPVRLIALVLQQAAALREAHAELAQVRGEVQRLRARVAELEEQNRPPTAPFRRAPEQRVATPKRPGRPPGHPGVHRARPEYVDETITVPLAAGCPHCGELLGPAHCVEQWIEDLPPVRPHVTHVRTWRAYCRHCDCEVRSAHPRQVSLADGAAGVHLGARALAAACALKHQAGLSLRRSAQVLHTLCGLRVSGGGLAQAFQRVATRVQADYAQLGHELLAQPALYTDETSWWLGGASASLWVFCTPQSTFYRVVAHRDRATFVEVVPADFAGVLVSDCLAVYDGTTRVQQKCYAHHFRAITAAVRGGSPAGEGAFLPRCRALLHSAMQLKSDPATPRSEGWTQQRRALGLAADALLADPRADPGEEAVRWRLRKQVDHLFTFLDHPAADATNNLAERQLRPAVIARKISCGNKTRAGADAWQVLASLAATCQQRAENFVDFLAPRLARSPP